MLLPGHAPQIWKVFLKPLLGREREKPPWAHVLSDAVFKGEPCDFHTRSIPAAITPFLIASTFRQPGDLHCKWCLLDP